MVVAVRKIETVSVGEGRRAEERVGKRQRERRRWSDGSCARVGTEW